MVERGGPPSRCGFEFSRSQAGHVAVLASGSAPAGFCGGVGDLPAPVLYAGSYVEYKNLRVLGVARGKGEAIYQKPRAV